MILSNVYRSAAVATVLLAIAGPLAVAQDAEPRAVPPLNPGDAVTTAALAEAEWVQGAAPDGWEAGKVYVLECWATWCGPCVRVIPHVNELYGKYRDKGLRVVGMNVWEDGKDKVAKFVADKGDGMAYPVGYVGRGGAFEKLWLKPAGVRGIPHAFIVQDGKLLFTLHPARLDEKMVEALLEGGEAQEAVVGKYRDAARLRAARNKARQDFGKARNEKDGEAMAAAIEALKAVDPETPELLQMRMERAIAIGNWDEATEALGDMAASDEALGLLLELGYRVASKDTDSYPKAFRKSLTAACAATLGKSEGAKPTAQVVLAKLHFGLGDKDAALAAAKQAVDHPGQLPAGPFAEFAKSVEAGEPMSFQQVQQAIRKAMRERANPDKE